MIAPAFLDELRQRTDLPGLLAGAVKLRRSGREWKGCCPFHGEKTPSFYVYADHYHCFGCGAHGDGVSWLTGKQGLSFPDAVRELAARAGLDVPQASPEARARAERAATLRDAVEAASTWFAGQLWGADGGGCQAYLERRGVSKDMARAFGLGFAPDSRGRLRRALAGMGDALLVEAGLLVRPGEGEPYDRFRGRLIFPIRDARGRAIGFGGRALGDATPKYLNSPDTPLFDKGRTLWNLDRAAGPARAAGRLIVVEGYMDGIALAQAGVGEVVAPMGTALTEAQLALAWRLVPEPLLCFDGDAAGRRAAAKAAARALPGLAPGRSLRFVTLPSGQDPDDLVRSQGVAAFEALIAAAEPLHEALWRGALAGGELTTPEGRAGVKARLDALVADIADATVREQYAILFRDRFWEAFGWRRGGGRTAAPRPAAPHRVPRNVESEVHAALVGLMNFPAVASDHAEAVAGLPIARTRLMALRNAIVDAVIWEPELDRAGLETALARAGAGELAAWARDNHALDYCFTSPKCDPARATAQLASLVATLSTLETNYVARVAARRELRELLGDEADDEALQARRAALFDHIRALAGARKAINETLYAFAQDAGADPGMITRTRTTGEERYGEDERACGTGRDEGSGGRAADRSQRGFGQEADRAREEARLHHL